jgi:hypothetical protein
MYEPAVSEQIPISISHPTAGLVVESHPEYTDTVIFKWFEPGTTAHKTIKRWKSRIANSIIQLIDDEDVYSPADVVCIMSEKRLQRKQHVTVQFARPPWTATSSEGIPVGRMNYRCLEGRHQSRIVKKTIDVERDDLWRFVMNNDLISLSIDNRLY